MKFRISPKYIPLLATALVLILIYSFGCVRYRNFASLYVIVSLLGDNAFLGVAAIGATFVILSGGIDLSVGAVVAFTGILIATLVGPCGMHPLLAIVIALLLGTLLGLVHGALIHFFEIPAFLVTLAGMFFARGMGFIVHSQSLGIKHPFYIRTVIQDLAIPLGGRVQLPFSATCFLAVFVVALFVAHYTRFGRAVYAVGDDQNSATLMGVPVGRTKLFVYSLSGLCSAAAGVVMTFYTQSGAPDACIGFELDAIASVVVGGTLLSGGIGFVGGTVMGVLIFGLIQNIINFEGNLNSAWTRISVGVLLLLFILLQNVVTAASRRSSAQGMRKTVSAK